MSAGIPDEGGYTLVELLVAMTVGMVLIFAALALMDGSWRLQAKTLNSIDATDRGRIAMDRITQQLDSRVCLDADTIGARGSIVTATDEQIEFYASVTSDTAPRLVFERRRMTYRPSTRDILLESWRAAAPPPAAPPANTAEPTLSRIVATGRRHVHPNRRRDGSPDADLPVLRGPDVPPLPPSQLAAPVSAAADRDRVALVKVSFAAVGNNSSVSTEFQNDSLIRSPTCLF
jgi:Prokaryotic N-terminal methylation motif